jgi:hypothetical protein
MVRARDCSPRRDRAAGLILPAMFLAWSSIDPMTTVVIASGALVMRRRCRPAIRDRARDRPESLGATAVFAGAFATLGLPGSCGGASRRCAVTAVAGTAPTPVYGPLSSIDQLPRDRDAIRRICSGDDLAATMRVMVGTIAVAMSRRRGARQLSQRIQIAYAAIKLPSVDRTAALSAPVLTAVGAALGRKPRLAVDLVL